MAKKKGNIKRRRERRRGGPKEKALSIIDLPEDLLKGSFRFVGPGQFRFVSGTCRHFRQHYPFANETTFQAIAASVPCAKLWQKDMDEQGFDAIALGSIAHSAAAMGNMRVLQWTYEEFGHQLTIPDFEVAAAGGHLDVLKWGVSKRMFEFDRYSYDFDRMDDTAMIRKKAAESGSIPLLKWIYQRTQSASWFTSGAGKAGHVHVLEWMVAKGLLDTNPTGNPHGYMEENSAWSSAAKHGHYHVLEWLRDNGFTHIGVAAHGAAEGGRKDVLLWCRDHGCEWDECVIAQAARGGQLETVKWLRENGCPWDKGTIRIAVTFAQPHVVSWARANGCPEPAPEDYIFDDFDFDEGEDY